MVKKIPAVFAAFLFVAACGGEGGNDGGSFSARLEPAGSNRLFLRGEEIERGAVIETAPEGILRIGGRPYRPAHVPRTGPADPDDGERFRERAGRIRAGAVRAWRGAREEGASPEEAAAAALASIDAEDRALLEGEPTVSRAGLLSIRFRGRPPEIWVLRDAGDAGKVAAAEARDFALRLVRFLEGEPPRVVLLGEEERWLEGEEAEEAIRKMTGEGEW